MGIEIAIDELGVGNDRIAYVTLPANKNTVIDMMDRAKIFGETFVRIDCCDEFPELNGFEFDEEPTLDELNFLAARIEEICEEPMQKCAYQALLCRPMTTINEAINRTYNLETIPVYPCANYREYGEIVLDNEMLEGLEDVPDEFYDLLDFEKIGRVMAERESGVFIDGYYVVTDCYEPVLVYNEKLPKKSDDWLFRLQITGRNEQQEILTLPTDDKTMSELAEKLFEKHIEDCTCFSFESAIPQIDKRCFHGMEDVRSLNEFAKDFFELSREDAAKCKAVLQNCFCNSVEKLQTVMQNLDRYDFDSSVQDFGEYGEKYILKMLPENFDKDVLTGIGSVVFTGNLFAANGCKFTEYGVVSGLGGQLYSPIIVPEQEQKNDFEMGGIS